MALTIKEKGSTYDPVGGLVSQKYDPIEFVGKSSMDGNDSTSINDNLVKKRLSLLQNLGSGLNKIMFYCRKSISDIAKSEASLEPPIAVLSSGRSAFIKKYLSVSFSKTPTGVNDVVALQSGKNSQGSLWYDPRRVKGSNAALDRNIYLFVHKTEYQDYRTALEGIENLTIVSWSAQSPGVPAEEGVSALGFGMSRYVVPKFFNYVFSNATHPKTNKKIWLVDDDVSYVTRFPGFKDVEKLDKTGTGFKGDTKKFSSDDILKLANSSIAKGGDTITYKSGLLQQVCLWDLKEVDPYNFSPIFISGKEDSSFNSFLTKGLNKTVEMTTGVGILKLLGEKADPTSGNVLLQDLKGRLFELSKICLQDFQFAVDGQGSINVLNWLTPYAAEKGEKVDVTFSKAIEQMMDLYVVNAKTSVNKDIFDPSAGGAVKIIFQKTR